MAEIALKSIKIMNMSQLQAAYDIISQENNVKAKTCSRKAIKTRAPNGSVPQNICSSGTFLLAGRCGRSNSPWKESVAGKKIIQGVRGDLKSRIAATGYLYGLLTTQDLNCAL